MKREIKIIHHTGKERYLTHLESEEVRDAGREDIASLYVPRSDLSPTDINEGRDLAELRIGGEPWFAGVIEDVIRHGDRKELVVESPERVAERAEPTGGAEEWDNVSDAEIIRDAIESVPELEVGSIEATNQAVSFMYSYASPAYKARKAEDVSPGLLRYNPDWTVDYGHLGRNKTHVTLSPRRDNVNKDFEVERKSSYDNVTHLQMLGAGEGAHQISAVAVSSDYDPDDPNDPEIWRTYPDKSITDEETLQRKADRYVEELKTQLLDVELTVKGIRVRIGDRFRVYIPNEEIDSYLEVVEHKRIINTEGISHEITLSNHRDAREDPEEKNRADLSNYNQALEGNSVPINAGGSRQPVTPDDNAVEKVYYPSEVVHEHRLNIRLMGLPYRAYSAGARDNADFESTVVGMEDRENVHIRDNWITFSEISPRVETSTLSAYLPYRVTVTGTDTTFFNALLEFRIRATRNDGSVAYFPNENGFRSEVYVTDGSVQSVYIEVPEDVDGYRLTLQARQTTDRDGTWQITGRTYWQGAGKHTHDPEFGVQETDAFGDKHFPENCDVLVNGDSLGVSFGDGNGEFTESVDIRGALREGEVNRIEITSDSIGHVQAYIEGDVYRQVRGRG